MVTDVADNNDPRALHIARQYVRERSREWLESRDLARQADHNRRREPRLMPTEYQFAVLASDVPHFKKHGDLGEGARRYAIVLDLSDNGCSLVLELGPGQDPAFPALNVEYIVKLDSRPATLAIVRWRGRINENLINAGFEFQS